MKHQNYESLPFDSVAVRRMGRKGRAGDGLEMNETKRWGHPGGFSLLEMLVVVAVILIISAIAIPNLLRSKISANEGSAVGSLKALNSACAAYNSTWGLGFPLTLAQMGPGSPATSNAAGLIDQLLASGTKSGYTFTYVSGAPLGGQVRTYSITANPVAVDKTGKRYFFTDQTGVIRQNIGAAATAASSPI